jgi:hypothetical protein
LGLLSLARSIIIVVQALRLTAEKHGGFTLRDGLENELRTLKREVMALNFALGRSMNLKPPMPQT